MTAPRPDSASVNKIFGAELPQASADEIGPETSSGHDDRDAWLRDNVPPHHI